MNVLSSFALRANLKVKGRPASLPPGKRIYAVGDIHGRLDLLEDVLSLICLDIAESPTVQSTCVFLGDYIDRGLRSRETIDRLIEHGSQHNSVFLKGNHELIAIKSLRDRTIVDQWLFLGGVETLKSYGVDPSALTGKNRIAEIQIAFHDALPSSHIQFFRGLKNHFSLGDFLFAHAGVRPGVPLTQQKESDLLWIRGEFLNSDEDFGKIIVHGHTPTKDIEIRPNRVNIDTGAFATGRLTCLVIEGDTLTAVQT